MVSSLVSGGLWSVKEGRVRSLLAMCSEKAANDTSN